MIGAQVFDSDPRNYYPETCTVDNPVWLHAPEAEELVITRINQWRLALGLSALARNEVLDRAAAQQTNYIRQFAPFQAERFNNKDDFSAWHNNSIGRGVTDRLRINGWRPVDRGVIVAGEIAGYFKDVSETMNFWQTSPDHRESATTPGFRELGVHTQCWKGWLLTFVVLASHPNRITVVYDPYTNALFLSNESNGYRGGQDGGFRPDFYRFEDLRGEPLHENEWLVWSDFVQLPSDAPPVFQMFFTDGVTQLRTRVDINANRAFPSQPTPTPSPTPSPTMTPTAGPSPTPRSAIATATLIPTLPPVNGTNFDVVLYYDRDYLTFINESGQALNWQPIYVVVSDFPVFEIGMDFFAEPFIRQGGNIRRFPANSCLQVFSRERYTGPGIDPETCVYRQAWRGNLPPAERFWLRPSFDIYFGYEYLATCRGWTFVDVLVDCGFDLPDRALTKERMTATPFFTP